MKTKLIPSLFGHVCGVLIVFLANPSRSAEPVLKPIEPFGGLKWNGGIVQTIKKINQMEGIEKLKAEGLDSTGGNQQPQASLKGLTNDSEIISALAGLMQLDSLVQSSCSYKDNDGVEHRLALGIENGITAEPIFLKGVAFQMRLNFTPSPGYAVTYPETVFPAILKKRDSKSPGGFKEIQTSCAFALTEVRLTSTVPLQTEKIKELTNTLKEKYKDYMHGEGNGGLSFRDSSGGALELEGEPSSNGDGVKLFIKYSRDEDQWVKLYQAHLSDLEKKTSASKPDKSNDL